MATASSVKTDGSTKTKTLDTRDIFRDGYKTMMSILVILTNDCG